MSTIIRVRPRNDEAELPDSVIQAVLRSYIEQSTGRKVVGDVTVTIDMRFGQVGVLREGMYTAHCELETKA
jgi:hypothetical protein